MSNPITPGFDPERNVVTLGGRRLVFHCHHYNVFLQRTIEEGLGSRAPRLLTAAGAEAARTTLEGIERDQPAGSPAAVLARAGEIFAAQGFGRANLAALTPRGGRVDVAHSHYAVGWAAKWGRRAEPGCFFAAGFFAGAVAAAGSHPPERVNAREVQCVACGADRCVIEVEVW